LASQGIGVFDKQNILIDANGISTPATHVPNNSVEKRTHQFAKTALGAWLGYPGNPGRILSYIKIENQSIKSWLTATSFDDNALIPQLLVKNWLAAWSIDISNIDDQGLRNFVSYRPQSYNANINFSCDNITVRLKFLKSLWTICKPNSDYDIYLLEKVLEYIYQQLGYQSLNAVDITDLNSIVQTLGLDPASVTNQNLIQKLRNGNYNSNLTDIFGYAQQVRNPPLQENDIEPFGIISRACLMLNFTSRTINNQLIDAQVNKSDLQFWTNHINNKLGIWETGNEPTILSDLWQDIEDTIRELDRFAANNNTTQFDYKAKMEAKLLLLKQFNIAYLWNCIPN